MAAASAQETAEGRIGVTLQRAFAQPAGQALPHDFLAMLAELDRSKGQPAPRR